MSKTRAIVIGLLVCLLGPWASSAVQAQNTGRTVHVHAVDPPTSVTPETGGLPGLYLRATFSLVDPAGTILKTDIESATLLLDGIQYTGKFSKLEDDWSVVLLLDTSGTLGGTRAFNDFRSIRDGLARSIGGAPGSTSFAVIPFYDRAPTVMEFNRDRDRTATVIRGLQAQASRPACLNDGLYEAIDKLKDAPGRRAVFAVTASRDDCATRSTQMVVEYATRNGVQLYAVGVEGYTVTRQDLEAFTRPTGGLAGMRGVADLGFALDNLMAVLASQWEGVWVLYPAEGAHTAELDVKLPDASVLSGSVSFTSDRDYARPPTIAIAGTAQSTLGGVRFNLDIINPERIDALDINLISKLTGRSVYQERVEELADSVLVPANDLVNDAEYTIVITALDSQGQVLSRTQPLDFRYEPLEAGLAITVAEWPSVEAPFYVISVAEHNLEGVATYRVWLETEQGGAPIRGTQVTYTAGQALRVPVAGVDSGSYVVRVQALGANDEVLVDSEPLRVAYTSPSGLARLVASLRRSTVAVVGLCALGVLAVVGLTALAWFLIPRGRGMRSVELALPEKARRAPRPPEPAPPPVERPAPARATPAPAQAPPARATPAPAPPAARAAPAAAPPATRAQPAGGDPPRRTPAPAQAPRPSAPPAATPAVAAGPSGAWAVVSMAEPAIAPFSVEIRKWPFRLGRGADNDGVIPVDRTTGVSGRHCVIGFADGRWFVQDDTSKFGTTVNGQVIPKGQPFALEDDALLGLGPLVKIRFRIAPGATPGAPR